MARSDELERKQRK